MESNVNAGSKPPDVRVAPLILPSPASLYRFKNVGSVFLLYQLSSIKVVGIIEREDGTRTEIPISVPGGNWLLVHVGDISGVDSPGFAKVDNPYKDET